MFHLAERLAILLWRGALIVMCGMVEPHAPSCLAKATLWEGVEKVVSVAQQWSPDDWESFALSLLQSRHGALNVQKVPATHKGDLGIDYYCASDAVIYQCYAVEEPVDIATRADRQKKKITTDLKKMTDGGSEIQQLFLNVKVRKWVLLAPLHDSKDVNLHCSKKTLDIREKQLAHVDPAFEVCVHDQGAFPGAALESAMAAITNISLVAQKPSVEELIAWQAGSADLLANATKKLAKRTGMDAVQPAVSEAVELFLKGNALLDALRSSAPDLHDKVVAAISRHAQVLILAGPKGGTEPGSILHNELSALTVNIKQAAPSLSSENAADIAIGVVSEWIMRCPLDFPASAA